MSEAKPQNGSTVKGYRSLTETEIGAMNDVKAISRKFLAELDMLATNGEYDKRWLAIARPDADC